MIPAVHRWATNAELIYDAYQLGYVSGRVLDATPGERGLWWDRFEPGEIELTLNPGWDFTALPFGAETFDTVAYDPPYKFNGNPHGLPDLSRRYGVDVPTRWQDRMKLILDGAKGCARIVKVGGHLLVKCQDQVVSGKMRWQTDEITRLLETRGMRKVDRFDLIGHSIPQPMKGRRQRHAHGRGSTLLVFRREKSHSHEQDESWKQIR